MTPPRPSTWLSVILARDHWILLRDELVRLARAAHIGWVAGFSVLSGLLGVLGLGAVSQGRELLTSVAREVGSLGADGVGAHHFAAFLVAALVWATTLYAGSWAALVHAPAGDAETMRLRDAAPRTLAVGGLAALPVCMLLATTTPFEASLGALAELAGLQLALGWSEPVPRLRAMHGLLLAGVLTTVALGGLPGGWTWGRGVAAGLGGMFLVWPRGAPRERGRRWTWRILGLLLIAAVCVTVAAYPNAFLPAAVLATTCALGAAAIFGADAQARRRAANAGLPSRFNRPVWWMLGIGVVSANGLFFGSLFDPLLVGRLAGTAAIGFWAFAAWGLGASLALVWLPYRMRLPPAAAIAAAILLLFTTGHEIETHGIRVTGAPPPPRATLAQRFERWLPGADPELPIFLVATSGGGQRAAWWTALTLAALDAQTCGGFSRNAFLLSGCSGGSLGVALHAAALADAPERPGACTPESRHFLAEKIRGASNPMATFLGSDFLSPVFAAAFFPDAVQLFVPVPFIRHDRAYALEAGWEAAWRQSFGSDRFAQPLSALYQGSARVPELLLNTTVVETGGRGAFSSAALELPGVLDLYAIPGISEPPLSAAISATARFPYMSPAASVHVDSPDGQRVVARLVDGGYYDNSGADTLGAVIDALPDSVRGRLAVVLITSDPSIGPTCSTGLGGDLDGAVPRAFPELLAPIEAATRVGMAHAAQSRREAIARLPERCGQVIELAMGDPAVHAPGDPVGAPPLVPPLGWYMGRASGERLVERALLRVTPGQPGMALLEAHPVAGPPEPPESPAPSTEP